MDELTMFASLRPDAEVLPADERAALRVSLFGSSTGSGADPALDAPPSIADDPESTLIALEPPRPPGPRRRSRRVIHVVLAIAVAAAVVTTLVVISRDHTSAPADTPIPTPIANGWVAFAASDADDDGDIYLVREGSNPRRIAGSDTDTTIEDCPAFSPDGTRLAFGQATGNSQDGFRDAALVITDLSADGVRTATTTIALDGMSDPPCGVWSADGRWVAFGVETLDEVWVVDTESDDIRQLTAPPSANDLDWAPDATELAIALNDENTRPRASDGVVVYSVTTDETRPLGGPGAEYLDWSPDGRTIAYFSRTSPNSPDENVQLWLMNADGTNERIVVPDVRAAQGRGPEWSPDGKRIAYQRSCAQNPATSGPCREETEVVLLTVNPDDPLEPAGTEVVIPPPQTTGPNGQPRWWYPYNVTWSPDGTTLLYNAWSGGTQSGLVAVPLDAETPPVVLSEDLAVSGSVNAFQSWGRQQTG
jgi:Tol biopolymer transport system component